MSARLVVVSNRVGSVRGAVRAGGLGVALVDALRQSGGLWFGWSGKVVEEPAAVLHEPRYGLGIATTDLTPAEHHEYYNGFANRCLWPLFHYRIDLTAYDRRYYAGYLGVNQRFARTLLPLLRPDDRIWVHDYHLIPCGACLRQIGCRQPIGFFLHIPFPSREVLLTLPHCEQLIEALMAYDLVGLQTARDVERLVDFVVNEVPDARYEDGVLHAHGRRTRLQACPVGIDTDRYAEYARGRDGQRHWLQARGQLRGRCQIIGVDRLDYTKGIPTKLAAFERLLQDHPDAIGQVEFLQIAPISRGEVPEYETVRHELEQSAGRINGTYADVDWTPLRYLNRSLSRRALAGLFRASRVGLVTPLRDGMNLVAKEYVAAQDPQDPGVLILSRFAGAAWQMKAALIVNPYDVVQVAEALQTARLMSLDERRLRHATLMQGLLEQDSQRWQHDFVEALRRAGENADSRAMNRSDERWSLPRRVVEHDRVD